MILVCHLDDLLWKLFQSDSKIIITIIAAIAFTSSQSRKIKYQLEVEARIL